MNKWRTQATSGDHLVLEYQNPTSTGLFYNLYADKLLRTNLVPEEVYYLATLSEWTDACLRFIPIKLHITIPLFRLVGDGSVILLVATQLNN